MKKTIFITNLLIVCMLMLTSAGTPVLAQSSDEPEPLATDAMPEPTIVFPGIERPDNPGGDPDIYPVAPPDPLLNDPRLLGAVPDTAGAAGFTHYMQAVNKMIALYRKNGELIDMVPFNDFWLDATTGTLCDTGTYADSHHGQPSVLFDHLAGRWVVADVAYTDIDNGPYYICVAVSNSLPAPLVPATPYFNGTYWYYYAISTDQGNFHFYPDSPKLGLWPDGYYLAADMIDVDNNGFNRTPRGIKVWALNREDLIGGFVNTFRSVDFYLSEQLGYEHLVPSNLIGIPPATGTPNYYAAIQPGKFHVWEFHADWNELSPSTFGTSPSHRPNYTINTDTGPIWAIGYIIPQLVSSERLDAHGERLGSPLQYRIVEGLPSLWATHPVLTQSETGMRWYEIRFAADKAPFFYQEGTYDPDTRYLWMGSLAVDLAGNMALGYSVSRSTMDPQIRYAGRLRTDPTGKMAQGEARFRWMGYPTYNGSQYDGDGLYDGPWGRQSQMSVDPLDECVFWYTNMYYDAQSNGYDWRTAIGWFSFPECRGGLTKRISLHTDDTQGNLSSGLDFETYSVGISNTGRYVVFSSEATNLVDDDTNGHRDVFIRDRDNDGDGIYDEPGFVKTTRVSMGLGGTEANGDSWEVSISGGGRYIVFSSDANNLVLNDNNGARDVFFYDRITEDIERISVRDDTTNGNGNAQSDQPFVNSTGQYVVFRSYASNLIPDDTNTKADIYLRDRFTERTYRISVSDTEVEADDESTTPTLSSGGRWIAFASRATNLTGVADTDGNLLDVFLRDWVNGTTTLISATAIAGDPGESYSPYVSGNGRFVAFASRATSLIPGEIPAETDFDADIFVYDRPNVEISRVSVNFFGDYAANGDSFSPSITYDGRYIAFASEANNLDVHLADLNARRDIYVTDRTLGLSGVYDFGLTQRISLSYSGGEPNEWSFVPVIAPFGSHVAYVSEASNLVTNDTNSAWDVFAFNSERFIPIFLSIPANIPGGVGDTVSVPVNFNQNGQNIDTTTFSIDFDEQCLSFDRGVAGAVTFMVPGDFITSWSYNEFDRNGEIDISVYDQTEPRTIIPDGTLLTVKLKVKATCMAPPGSTNNARVGFSNDPPPSFGSYGQSIPGYATDGFVRILDGKLGDCNGDGLVDAGDLSGLVLEIFDGDDVLPKDTPGGTFPGNPVGCNPNQDMVVDAGDLSCTVLIIWGGGSAACAGGLSALAQGSLLVDNVSLVIPEYVPATPGQRVALPISLDSNGKDVSSVVLSIDYDQSWLSFNSTDQDKNGLPDAIHFNLPEGFVASATFDPQDTDGEIDIVIYDPGLEQASLPSDDIVTVFLNAGQPQGDFIAKVKSSKDPRASFGSPAGTSLPGIVDDGSVLIFGTSFSRIFLPVTMFEK
jgi:hypothetical protein